MIEDALNVIENYLTLVRKHLPEKIAIEVIDELRSYVIEAAEEEGGGVLTVDSAKRTVSRFGAPSEVAEEYIHSMIIEEDEPIMGSVEEESPPDSTRIEPEPVSNLVAYGKFLFTATIWILLTSIPTLLLTGIIIALFLSVTAIIGFFLLLYNWRIGKSVTKSHFDEWPLLQRLVAIPRGFIPELGKRSMVLEGILTIQALILFIITPSFWLTVPFLVLRLGMLVKRMGNMNPSTYAWVDAVLEFLGALTINIGFFWAVHTYYGEYYWYSVFTPFTMITAIYFVIYLNIRLVSLTPELWVTNDRGYPSGRDVPTSYSKTTFKGFILGVFWSLMIPLFTIPLFALSVPESGYFVNIYLVLLLMFQIPGIIAMNIGNAIRAYKKGITWWDISKPSWSRIRRLLSFPKGVFMEQSSASLRLDMSVTSLFMAMSVITIFRFSYVLDLIVALGLFIISLGIRLVFLDERWKNQLARKHDKGEYISTIFALVAGCLLTAIVGYTGVIWGSKPGFIPYMWQLFLPAWGIFSTYLLYSTVARGSTLWSEKAVSEPTPSETTDTELSAERVEPDFKKKVDEKFRQILVEVLMWSVGITVLIITLLLAGSEDAISIPFLVVMTYTLIFLTLIALSGEIPAIIYYAWKKRHVISTSHPSAIGKRNRKEAIVDMVGTLYLVFIITVNSEVISRVVDRYISISFLEGFISWTFRILFWTFIISALVFRLAADVASIVDAKEHSMYTTLKTSAVLAVITIGLVIGISLQSGMGTILEGNLLGFTGVLIVLCALMILQAVVTKHKIIELAEHQAEEREHVTVDDHELKEVEIPTN